MKNKITILILTLLTVFLTYAGATEPDTMHVHFTGTSGDSVLTHAIANIDSIVYYAPAPTTGTITDDRDNITYNWVTIGTQVWMAENLMASVTRVDSTGGSADTICQSNDVFAWENTDAAYGKLYSWQAAIKACPSGWHLPSDTEWTILSDYLTAKHPDAESTALKSTFGWRYNKNGTDIYGFNALPGGFCSGDGKLSGQGVGGYWWSNTPSESLNAYRRYLAYSNADVYRIDGDRSNGGLVRCVRD